jgi:hypothetical protein
MWVGVVVAVAIGHPIRVGPEMPELPEPGRDAGSRLTAVTNVGVAPDVGSMF